MSGRGSLLSLFKKKIEPSEASSSSGDQAKDSGLDADRTVSSGEYRRVARDNIASDLETSVQNTSISIGRGCGRGKFLDSFKALSQPLSATGSSDSFLSEESSSNLKSQTDSAPADQTVSEKSSPNIPASELFLPDNIYGTKGTPVNLACNYIGLNSDPSKGVFLYEVRFNPTVDSVHLRMKYLSEHKDKFGAFMTNMERCCEAFGMQLSKPKTLTLDQDRVDSYVDALRRNICGQTQIVVCICPTSRDDRYSAIKKICCSEIPVASQVINSRTLFNEQKNRSIVQKIILQMNCKLGGSLWSVKIPFKNVMICGIDSYHDPKQKSNSVAAFVASLNSSYTHWYSKAVMQTKREELVNGLTSSFEMALKCYKKRNGHLPDSVIIYRDGVGDGQLNLCSKCSYAQIVQKRINTRFFLDNGRDFSNPSPGTVVDKSITRSQMYDFFLVAQMVRQGTVTPTHFVVLQDDSNYGPDIIQRLTYKLCFLYYNWPGTVRVPACCLYAHKMAYLIGQSIQRDTSSNLSEKLFYL
ncbi:hypothetical protein ACLKA6_014053 [Drosophila palustris]